MNCKIRCRNISVQEMDCIGFLWEKLRDHHRMNSTHFKERYSTMTFFKRKNDLLDKLNRGQIHIDIAESIDDESIVGYCISSVKTDCNEKEGDIDSIYVEANYRKHGIGDELLKLSLHWLTEENVLIKKIIVAEGNESVFHFYEKHGFYHLYNVLLQKDER
jgi:diamine N-acetyltransferase